MSQTPSKKMLALNAVLLAVLLVSLPLQLRPAMDDFWSSLGGWTDCNGIAINCTGDCQSQLNQCLGQGQDPWCQQQYQSCINACGSGYISCWTPINWPEPVMDFCTNARAKHDGCVLERSACLSAEMEDCYTPYYECRESSGIDQCE
jgi:hypothetical protein